MSLKAPLIITGVLVLVGAVVGGGVLIVKNLPENLTESLDLATLTSELGIGRSVDFTYMPLGAYAVRVIRPRARWNASIAEQLRDADQATENASWFENRFGFPHTDIESITLFGSPDGMVHVIDFATAVDQQTLIGKIANASVVDHNGVTCYEISGDATLLHFVSGTQVIVAPRKVIDSIIDGTFVAGDPGLFALVDSSSDLFDATTRVEQDRLWMELNNHPLIQMVLRSGQDLADHGTVTALFNGVRLSGDIEYDQRLVFSSNESAAAADLWLQEQLAAELEKARTAVAQFETRLESAREAEQQRVQRAANGENPFASGNLLRVSDIEEQYRRQQAIVAALESSKVSHSGNELAITTTLDGDHLDDDENLREKLALETMLVSNAIGWSVPEEDLSLTSGSSTASGSAAPSGNQRRVFEFTYNIERVQSLNAENLDEQVETTLMRMPVYVPESATVDVAQARITFQLTNGFDQLSASQALRRIGFTLDPAPVEERELLRELPERDPRTTTMEFAIIESRGVPQGGIAAAEAVLATIDGYVSGSLKVDEGAGRVSMEFTRAPNHLQVISMLRGPLGLALTPVRGPQPGLPRPIATGSTDATGPLYLSLYYESYNGSEPVDDAVRSLVDGLEGYLVDTLEHDADEHYVTFQIEQAQARVSLSRALGMAGFGGAIIAVGRQTKTSEELRRAHERSRRLPERQ